MALLFVHHHLYDRCHVTDEVADRFRHHVRVPQAHLVVDAAGRCVYVFFVRTFAKTLDKIGLLTTVDTDTDEAFHFVVALDVYAVLELVIVW